MTSYGTASSVPAAKDRSITLYLLRATATGALTAHLDDAGLCVGSGWTWPCQGVVLVDHTVVVL